ncbi:MAG: bifunctional phosphopantothenoylcysteine decarboxylase/phosphopantothenate--cysteine ligase CoaBC, partial [Bacteroidota bacterium]
SIAAYKAAFLTRLFIKQGAEVQVLMTPAATNFITPLTLSTLSKRPVYSQVSTAEGWNNHVELGLWADAMVIAPATATTLAKLANGICDNVIAAVYLSARCPVFFAPAMDLDMWQHPATLRNVASLQAYGNHLIPVGYGELASGLVGAGRLAEPEDIVRHIVDFFQETNQLVGRKMLVTAGPTYEPIDPVRFIGNRSSGKMGVALAKVLATRGAKVELVLGPSAQTITHPNITVRLVQTAQEMYAASVACFESCDAAILAAAVADYRPKKVATQKIKKKTNELQLELEKTTDIAAVLGKAKQAHQYLIGFALETNDELEHAKGKLERKNFDFIVLNSLRDAGAGFRHDTNKITILHRDGKQQNFPLKSKMLVAVDIVNTLVQGMHILSQSPNVE